MNYWQKEMETMPRAKLKELQLERLKHIAAYCYENVPFYHKKFDDCGFSPYKIKTLKDIEYIPYTTKEDIRDNYPFGMFAVPKKKIVRLHASSGTTGKPTVVGYTRNDLDMWSDVVARLCVSVGVTDEDTAQISFGYGLFTGALGLHYGLEKIGVSIVPASSGNTEKQVMLLKDFDTTLLISTPSYALHIGEVARDMGYSKDDLSLRIGLFGSEGCTEEMRNAVEDSLGVFATDNYGMSELIGQGSPGIVNIAPGCILPKIIFIQKSLTVQHSKLSKKERSASLLLRRSQKKRFRFSVTAPKTSQDFPMMSAHAAEPMRVWQKSWGAATICLKLKGSTFFHPKWKAYWFPLTTSARITS